jgi:hypothetical protein
MEQSVTAQPYFPVIRAPHAWPLDRRLLAHHHAVAAPVSPSVRLTIGLRLIAFAHQIADLFFHQQADQRQAGLPDQLAYALLPPARCPGHRQHHLHRRVPLRSQFLQTLHGPVRFNLIWFLQSCSPFSREKKLPSA